jgi:glutaredoxin
MGLIPNDVRRELAARFAERLSGPVRLTLYTRPGSSRLILPAGMGCPTCEDARQMAELLQESAPDKVTLEVVDAGRDEARVSADGIEEVPTITIGTDAGAARIAFQGLPTGTEFPALIDAVERSSRGEHGLSRESLDRLARLEEPAEVLVFATPT